MVNRRISLFAIFGLLCAGMAACSPPAAPTPQAAPTSAGPAATPTLVAVPPQPTSATLAPRTSVAFVSPTPVPLISGGTPITVFGATPNPPPTAAPAAAAPTNPPPTAAPAAAAPTQPATTSAGPVPTAPGVATGRRSEVKFVFLTPLKPAEEAEPPELIQMRAELKKVTGFLEITDIDEGVGALVGYDAGLISVEQLIVKFADLKHPVKRQ
jgi:hypothetical protein